MSTKNPHSSYRWDVFVPFRAFEILTKNVKTPAVLAILGLAVLGAISITLFVYYKGLPFLQKIEPAILQMVDEVYPKELVVTVKNGSLTTNVKEPYYLEFPSQIRKWMTDDSTNSFYERYHMIVFDTKAEPIDFAKHDSLVLFSKDFIMYYRDGNRGETGIETYSPDLNVVLNKQIVMDGVQTQLKKIPLEKIHKMSLPVVPIVTVLASVWTTSMTLFILTILVWILMKSTSLHYRLDRLYIFTLASGAIFIAVFRLINNFLPANLVEPARGLTHQLILGTTFLGLQLTKKSTKNASAVEKAMYFGFYPVFAGKDLIESQRTLLKKIFLGLGLGFLILMPWISFFMTHFYQFVLTK